MALKILLSTTLRKCRPDYDPTKGIELEVNSGTTVAELCRQMEIPAKMIRVIMIDGKKGSLDYILEGCERVNFYPAMGGG